MEKTGTKAKATKTIKIELDSNVIAAISDIAKLAGLTSNDVISVMLSTFVINEKKKTAVYPNEPSVELWTLDKDKKIKKQKTPVSKYRDNSFEPEGK